MSYKSKSYVFNVVANASASDTAPEDTTRLWLDTSVEPSILKFFDKGKWVIANDQNTSFYSALNLTKKEFNLELEKKVGNDEIISKINATAEQVKIQALKIALEGIVTANENFTILKDGSMVAKNGTFIGKVEGSSFYTSKISTYTYTAEDEEMARALALSDDEPTEEQLAKYDLNLNGYIESHDVLNIMYILNGKYGYTNGVAEIEDIVAINLENTGKIILERRINGMSFAKTEINGGSITKTGSSNIYINGEPVVTSISGTIARFG